MSRPQTSRVFPTRPTYIYSRAAVQQTVAVKNYISVMNPANSDKLIAIGAAFISSVDIMGNLSVTAPVRGHRISGASGGTAVVTSSIVKLLTSDPSPVAIVTNDATTLTGLGSGFFNIPVAISNRATAVHDVTTQPGNPVFTCLPGEGVVIRTAAGDTNIFVNVSIIWTEVPVS
jgi:hypothetical protein